MAKTEVYQLRLDSEEKKQAFEVFAELGLTPAQAIRIFFKQVVQTRSIPFPIQHARTANGSAMPTSSSSKNNQNSDIFDQIADWIDHGSKAQD